MSNVLAALRHDRARRIRHLSARERPGQPFRWYTLLLTPGREAAYTQAVSTQSTIRLEDYGTVLTVSDTKPF